jgi:hypothetical protein
MDWSNLTGGPPGPTVSDPATARADLSGRVNSKVRLSLSKAYSVLKRFLFAQAYFLIIRFPFWKAYFSPRRFPFSVLIKTEL